MIRHYRWQPDTCGCQINEVHDDEADTWGAEEIYINQQGEVFETKRCKAHAAITDVGELYGVLHKNPDGENRRKNEIEGHLLEEEAYGLSEPHPDMPEVDGVRPRRFKSGVKYQWGFSGEGRNRVLHIGVTGATLTPAHKTKIKAFSESKHGPGKIDLL